MITLITGKIIKKTPTNVTIVAGGVGYNINISLQTYQAISEFTSHDLMLYTHLQITEDAHSLWGFFHEEEREVFRLLIKCSGIGCNTARVILSSLIPSELKSAVLNEDIAAFKKIKGVGDTKARLVILELKPKFLKQGLEATKVVANDAVNQDAIAAMVSLGFNKKESEQKVIAAIKIVGGGDTAAIIKQALK